jgi:hypothetical protein
MTTKSGSNIFDEIRGEAPIPLTFPTRNSKIFNDRQKFFLVILALYCYSISILLNILSPSSNIICPTRLPFFL